VQLFMVTVTQDLTNAAVDASTMKINTRGFKI